jgi:hypothetical protein
MSVPSVAVSMDVLPQRPDWRGGGVATLFLRVHEADVVLMLRRGGEDSGHQRQQLRIDLAHRVPRGGGHIQQHWAGVVDAPRATPSPFASLVPV